MWEGEDLAAAMVHQHRHLTAILRGLDGTQGHLKREAFDQLRQFLAFHEAAEQRHLHGPAGGEPDQHRGIIQARLQEEEEIAGSIRRMEGLDAETVEFDAMCSALVEQIHRHVAAEEYQEIPAVRQALPAGVVHEAVDALQRVPQLAEEAIGAASFDDWLDHAHAAFEAAAAG